MAMAPMGHHRQINRLRGNIRRRCTALHPSRRLLAGWLHTFRTKDDFGHKDTEEFCFLLRAQALRPYRGVSSFLEVS